MKKENTIRKYGIELEFDAGLYEDDRDMDDVYEDIRSEIDHLAEVKGDGSVSGDCPVEVASIPLTGLSAIDDIVAGIERATENPTVNASCGYHLHIDTSDILSLAGIEQSEMAHDVLTKIQLYSKMKSLSTSPAQKRVLTVLEDELRQISRPQSQNIIAYFFAFYVAINPILKAMQPNSRQNNQYCRDVGVYSIQDLLNMNDAEVELKYYDADNVDQVRRIKKTSHSSRYFGVNLHSMLADGHLEIRHHSGTLNVEKIKNWVILHTSIIDRLHYEFETRNKDRIYTAIVKINTAPTVIRKVEILAEYVGLEKPLVTYILNRIKTFETESPLTLEYNKMTALLDNENTICAE